MAAASNNQCCVWDSYKYALYTKFREPKMYRHVAAGEWDLIPKRCRTHPREASFVHKYAPMDTPLNRLLRTEIPNLQHGIYDMKYQAVTALLDTNASAALGKDTFLRTPLHWACMDVDGNHLDKDDSILLMLMDRAPQAVQMKDIEKRTPLHYLVARNDDVPLDVVAKLAALYPEALSTKDEVGETPMDIAMSRKDELKNANDLIQSLSKLKSMLTPND